MSGEVTPPTLVTLGYEKRSLEEFLDLLAAARIRALVDVRDVAWSHKKGFAKKALAEAAQATGLEYLHAQFAGNPKRLRREAARLDELLDAYRRHLDEDPSIVERLHALIEPYLRRGEPVCLMCFERDPLECHRSVLAARWQERYGGSVEHR